MNFVNIMLTNRGFTKAMQCLRNQLPKADPIWPLELIILGF